MLVECWYGPDHRHLHGIHDAYKYLYHRDIEGAKYETNERLFEYEVDKVTLHSWNEGNAWDFEKLPPTTASPNLFYSLHVLSEDRTEEDHNPHKDSLSDSSPTCLNVNWETKKVLLACHHPVLAIGADWVPG